MLIASLTALAIEQQVGNFSIGKDFDALLIDMNGGPSELVKDYSTEEIVQKFVYLADDRNVTGVYVAGAKVK
jgi:guanine deaminase